MRTFVAVEISDEKIIGSIEKFQKEINIDAKPVEPRNLHFTLQFLGEISDGILEKVTSALRTVKFSSFDVSLRGVGAFPRVVWIGTDEDGRNQLVQLAKKVEKALLPLGFLSERTFKPHITVFRIKKKIKNITEELNDKKATDFGAQKITEIKLKKSELTSNGPIYSDLVEIKAEK